MGQYRDVTDYFHKGTPLREILRNHEKWVREREGEKADLIGADLSQIDLSEAYLRSADLLKANFKRANLEKINLSGANLFGANLTGANLRGANLRAANLEKANLMDSELRGADLAEANLKGAHMPWARMERTSAVRASLVGAFMRGTLLNESDFYKADLRGAVLLGARLEKSKMKRANLSGADMSESHLEEAQMPYADLSGVNLTSASLQKAYLESANLRDANLAYASFLGADLTGANLSGIVLHHTVLSEWNVTGVTCTHILQGEEREVTRLSPGDFEKRFGRIARLFEMIMNVPLSSSAYYIGRSISSSINSLTGLHVIDFRGVERLSDNHTKFIFRFLDEGFFEEQREAFETELRFALNEYLNGSSAVRQPSYVGGILEEFTRAMASQEAGSADEEKTGMITERLASEKLLEHYSRLEKMGEDIYGIVHSVLK
jgi:uncharacterized protein YjbI with pentapeptide repeats